MGRVRHTRRHRARLPGDRHHALAQRYLPRGASGLLNFGIRPGASGNLAGDIVAKANPDGYTLLAASVSTHSFSPALKDKLNYDPVKDFAPITLFAISQNLLVANPSLRVNTVSELVALAKSKPRALNYASGGTGSTSHPGQPRIS